MNDDQPLQQHMAQSLRLLVVNDDQLRCESLVAALTRTRLFHAVDQAYTPEQVLRGVRLAWPDTVLIDNGLPPDSLLGLTRQLCAEQPRPRVFILGVTAPSEEAGQCLQAGASGCIPSGASLEQLLEHLLGCPAGQATADPAGPNGTAPKGESSAALMCLTRRERQILQLVAEGLSNKDIAHRLGLSLHTVKNHVHQVLEKLAAPGRYEAVCKAYGSQWFKQSRAPGSGTKSGAEDC